MSKKDELTLQVNELESKLNDNLEALQNLVFQNSMQQLEDVSQIKKTKKVISRIKTLISEAKNS